ncbi:MAG: cell wall-binding repeat-containing protein [Herbiconiux sp.]|nr:cell wall-binding repeat-containing protein [Herbiconiux sp.]
MLPPSPTRSRSLLGGALVLALAATLAPAALSSASAEELVPALAAPTCPQASAVVGFPLYLDQLVPRVDIEAGVTVSLSGTEPVGLVLSSEDRFKGRLVGKPAMVETKTFDVIATRAASGGGVEKKTTSCTMAIKAAPTFSRIAGTDRYDQSVKVSKATFTTADVVYLTSGEKFADALGASAVAVQHKAPLLLTQAGTITTGVIDEIKRLGAKDVVVVGGALSVADSILAEVKTAIPSVTVTRVGGVDRYAVSRNLIAHPAFGATESETVFVATGATFPDALSATPAAALVGAPVLLVNGAEAALTPDEKTTLAGVEAKKITIVGGELSVSPALQADFAKTYTTSRIAGQNRYDVSLNINRMSFAKTDAVYIASGEVFPDALTGGIAAAMAKAPLYINDSICFGHQPAEEIGRMAPLKNIYLGGPNTLPDSYNGQLPFCKID